MSSTKSIKDFFGPELYKQLKSLHLKPKQILFCTNYIINDFNATKSYLDSKMGGKKCTYQAAGVQANELTKNPKIQQAIRLVVDAWLDSQKLNLDRKIIKMYTCRAFYDPSQLIDSEGCLKFKTLEEVPEDLRYCIDGIEKRFFGKDADRSTVTYKLADRESAIANLAKYILLFKDAPPIDLNLKVSDETAKKIQDIFRVGQEPIKG